MTTAQTASCAAQAPCTDHEVSAAPFPYKRIMLQGFSERNLRKEEGLWTFDESVPYSISLLHAGNMTDLTLSAMMALQDTAADTYRKRRQSPVAAFADAAGPHALNPIDYKSLEEVCGHFETGGLGLAALAEDGTLIGHLLLSINQPVTGPFAETGEKSQATIGWLMVKPEFGRNGVCNNLIAMAVKLAEELEASELCAHVRLHNERALSRFTAAGFFAAGDGVNAKDGSAHIRMFRPAAQGAVCAKDSGASPVRLDSLRRDSSLRSVFDRQAAQGTVGKWDAIAGWFTFHKARSGAQGAVIPLPQHQM